MVNKNKLLRTAVPVELQHWVENRRIQAHLRVSLPIIAGTLLNALVIVAVMAGSVPPAQLIGFASCACGVVALRMWIGASRNRAEGPGHLRQISLAIRADSLFTGAAFAIPTAAWLPHAVPSIQLLLAVAAVSQIAAAAFTARTMPRAAIAIILPMTLGLSWGLAQIGGIAAWGTIILLVAASGLLFRMTLTISDAFVKRILHDRKLTETTRTVKLLLNDYQENGSDWLFEVAADRRLLNVSPRFAQAAGLELADLEGCDLAELFNPNGEREALSLAIAHRKPLRGLVLTIGSGESQRWWSLSGRPYPQIDADGTAYRGVISDISEQRLAEGRIHHMAHFDALTGLPNRALFNQKLGEVLDDQKGDASAALLLIDVDHFKTVNDMYGHPTGDAFLRAIAERMARTVVASGLGGMQPLVARIGGDEFAVLVAGESACDHAVRLAELLIETAQETITADGHEINAGISIGIALAPQHAVMKHHLMSNADIALYAAKNDGRGIWEMFAPGMDAALHERHTLARDLRHAVGNGELRLFIQPLVDVETEVMTGYEALLRWQHPERGLIPPDTFIPIAEETGLIIPIGEWVIRTAIAEAASWPDKEAIAINLSPLQLASDNLLPVIIHALAEHQLDPTRVEFEITENVLLRNSEANIAILNRLHDLGVKIALDDFGTGYASLNYLLTFPFDKIKIDRRFISDLATRHDSQAIVGAVISLANELGMCTLAEGVEESDQFDLLRQHGCRMVQGWLFGKALPSENYHPHEASGTASAPIEITSPGTVPEIIRKRKGSARRAA